jgi:TonB family protein
MSPVCPSALESLDDSLTLLYESSRKLKAAQSVDLAEVIQHLKIAGESGRLVRELVWSELPAASWRNREELDALNEKIQAILDARTLEQLRSRLLALATELEHGTIVHRRAHRLNELNQLRDQAVNELRSQAGSAPQTLPGPDTNLWVEWACSLQEPQDAESLQILRDGFAHLDDFVSNLEFSMWIASESPTSVTLPEPNRSAGKIQPEPSRVLTTQVEEPVASSAPNLEIRVDFDPQRKEVTDPILTENPPLSHFQDVAASRETLAVQCRVPVLSDALATPLVSLDEPLSLLHESLAQLKAAQAINLAEVIDHFKTAAEAARNVSELVLSELPEVVWQTREELDTLLEKIETILDARAVEQQRARLLALASVLESGTIVHRRAHRLSELNQLRDWAVNELRSQAGSDPQTLPGPDASQWIGWACGLREPQDAESLQILRERFAHLDDFVANLETNMWMAAGSPTPEIVPEAERPAEKTRPEPTRLATTRVEDPVMSAGFAQAAAKPSEGHEALRFPHSLYEPSLSALDTDTLTPNYVIPPRTEEEIQSILAQEQALLASMMGLVSDPARHFNGSVEPPFTAAAFRETSGAPATLVSEPVSHFDPPVEHPFTDEVFDEPSSAPASTPDLKTGVEQSWVGKRQLLLVIAAVLMLAALATVLWRSRSNRSGNGPVKASAKVPDLTRSNSEAKGYAQSAMALDAGTHTSSPKIQTKEQSKAQDRSADAKLLAKASPAKPANQLHDGVLQPPAAAQQDVARVNKEETPPNATAGIPGEVPGGVPNGVSNNLANIARDIPVAVPKIASQKVRVSSGVAQGLLIHQVTPKYPSLAHEARIQGTVVLQAVIGKDGSVQNLRVLSGHPMLTQAAMNAVKQWRYKPYYVNGEPVEADTQINVNFNLSDR